MALPNNAHPPPFALLAMPLLRPLRGATDAGGCALLAVNLALWRPEWTLADPRTLVDVQWCLHKVIGSLLDDCPAASKVGLSILSDGSKASEGVSVDEAHIAIVEFIKMTIPVKLNDLYILKDNTLVNQQSNAWLAGLKSISNMFAQSHFDAIMQSLGVNWNTYSRSSILSVIPASSLPQEYGGSFFMMDHASWYQQLKHSSNFSNSVLELINQDEKRILELYGLSDSGLDVVPTTSMKRTFPRRTTSLGFTASREATAPMLDLLAGSELSHDSLVAPKLEEESVPAAQDPRVIVNLDTSTIHSNDSFTSNDDDRSILPLNTNDLSDTGDLNDIMSLMDQAILMQQQQEQHEAVKQQPKQSQQPVVSITESPQIIDSQTPSTPTVPGPPPPPPPPPPPIPSATKKAVPSAVFESISSAPQHKQDIKIVRFKSAVRVHRYEVPPRETWAADVWWTEEDDIGVLEDWEEELYNGGPAKAVEVSGTAVGVAEKDEGATADDSITAAA